MGHYRLEASPVGFSAALGFVRPQKMNLFMMNHRDANERNEGGPEYPAQFHSVGQMPAADELMRFRHVLFRQTRGVWITPTLILANTVVFLAMALVTKNLMEPPVNAMIQWGANFGPRTMHGEWWRLLTSMFLHFGPLHLACNMWALWNLGQLVERLVGNVGFLILYLAAGLLGGLASLAWNPEIASAGASGAVFGVSGGLIGFLALRRDSIPMPILQSLQSSMASFVGFNVLFGIMIPNIDMACHLGGLIGGVFCGLILSQPIEVGMAARRWREASANRVLSPGESRPKTDLDSAREMLAAGACGTPSSALI